MPLRQRNKLPVEDCDHCDAEGEVWEPCDCYQCEYSGEHSRYIECANCEGYCLIVNAGAIAA